MDPKQNFYILALAPNAARLSVRFFYVNSFGKIIQNIADHYERLKIVKPAWEEQDYLGIRDMLNETVNQKSKDKTPVPEHGSPCIAGDSVGRTISGKSVYLHTDPHSGRVR